VSKKKDNAPIPVVTLPREKVWKGKKKKGKKKKERKKNLLEYIPYRV